MCQVMFHLVKVGRAKVYYLSFNYFTESMAMFGGGGGGGGGEEKFLWLGVGWVCRCLRGRKWGSRFRIVGCEWRSLG